MISPFEWSILLAVGLAAGLLGGMLGIGGSIMMIPAMAVIFQGQSWDDQHLFQASAMIVNVVVALPAVRRHQKAGVVPYSYVKVFLPCTLAFMILGVVLSNALSGPTLRLFFASFMLYVVAETLIKVIRKRQDPAPDELRVNAPRAGFVGAITGTLGGLLGIGGGIVSVPLGQIICRLPIRAAIAASATTMVYSSALGASLKLATLRQHDQSITMALLIALALAPTALLGGYIGSGWTHKVPTNALRMVLAGVLLIMAARMSGLLDAT